jgi:hypothetical protein
MGMFHGMRSVTQTLQGWHDALVLGPCSFDQPWYNDGFNPDQCGHVALTGGLAGWHSTMCSGFDVSNQEMDCFNSWGPNFGVGGGYFRYSFANLVKLRAAGATMVCPALPAATDLANQ